MPANRISSRIAAIAESATLKVDAKAKALIAQGRPVITYAAGEPDFPTPNHIVEAAIAAAKDPKNHRYTQAVGLPELREAIVAKTLQDSGTKVDASQVIVTNGGKQAVYQSFAVIVEQDYKVTVEQLEKHYTDKTKALLRCSPSNPTGAVYSKEEIEAIGKWVLSKENLWVITDEIYQNLVYDGVKAYSITEVVPELADRTIMVNGVAKSYAMTGWRLGWMIAPADAAKAAANLQSHLTSNVSNISQRAAIAALTGDQAPIKKMLEAFDRRRKLAVSELSKIDDMKTPTPQGAFYVYPDVTGLFGKEIDGRKFSSSLELADFILEKAEVALVPGEAFGPSGFLRLSYALGDDQLLEGIHRLQRLFS